MGTITGISELDPIRWKNSQWRNLQVELLACMCCFNCQFFTINNVEYPCDRSCILEQVGWDESTAGERRNRVSIWEIEPVTAPFFICPPPYFRTKRPRQPGMPGTKFAAATLRLVNTFVIGILTSIILLSPYVYNFEKTDPCLGGNLCMLRLLFKF